MKIEFSAFGTMVTAGFQLIVLSYLAIHCCGYRRLKSLSKDIHSLNSSQDSTYPRESYDNTLGRVLLDSTDTDHLVTSLPGLTEPIKHYAGHVNIDPSKDSNIFYWLFEAPQGAEKLPLLIWLNGGPGCSSMDGLWLELGPLRLQPDGTVKLNPHSWHKSANMLFVDQPVGTGFAFTKSRSGYATNDDMVNTQFYKFLLEFFKKHPRYVSSVNNIPTTRQFFMSGESHAGHYIPSISAYILQKNTDILTGATATSGSTDPIISLEGIALGNPWLDPYYQYDASAYAHGQGLISLGQRQRLEELEVKCQKLLKAGKLNNQVCFSLLDKIVDSTAMGAAERVLMYDTRKYVARTSSFPPGHEPLERYLNRPDVKSAIHASKLPHKFEECANPPFNALSHQDGKGITKELASILNQGLRVLVFAGQYDMICNHIGIEKALSNVPWQHRQDWMLTAPGVWAQGGRPVGSIRAFKNLEYLIVFNAGHMVPMDQPAISLSMINAFLQNHRYASTTGQNKLGAALSSPAAAVGAIQEGCAKSVAVQAQTLGSETQPADSSGEGKGLIERLSFWQSSAGRKKNNFILPSSKLRRTPAGSQSRKNIARGRTSHLLPQSTAQRSLSAAADTDTNANANRDSGVTVEVNEAVSTSSTSHPSPANSLSSNIVPYSLVLGHVTPLNSSVLVHARLVHHSAASHLQQKHHTDKNTAAQILKGVRFEILIEPGRIVVAVDTTRLLHNNFYTDLILPGLRDGQEYKFSTITVNERGERQQASRRVISATPGCFNPDAVQCCGNGMCVNDASQSEAYCRCDVGHTGSFCAQHEYSAGSIEHTIACPSHFHGHREILKRIPRDMVPTERHIPLRTNVSHIRPTDFCPFINTPGDGLCSLVIELFVPLQRVGDSWDTRAQMEGDYGRWIVGIMQDDVTSALSADDKNKTEAIRIQVVRGEHPRAGGDMGILISHPEGEEVRNRTLFYPMNVLIMGSPSDVAETAANLLAQLSQTKSPLRAGLVSSFLSPLFAVFAVRVPVFMEDSTPVLPNIYNPADEIGTSWNALFLLSICVVICACVVLMRYRCSARLLSQQQLPLAVSSLNTIFRDKDGTARV